MPAVPVRLAQRPHRLAERVERRERVAAPPAGARCSTTSSHQRSGSSYPAVSARTASGSIGGAATVPAASPSPARPCPVLGRGPPRVRRSVIASECAAGRSMKRTGTSVVQRPADRHPLRGELGQRPERRPARLVHDMGEQRDRRPHAARRRRAPAARRPRAAPRSARPAGPPRPARPGPRGPIRARGAGPRAAAARRPPARLRVTRSPRGRRGRSPSSRPARGPPSPGTPAR